MHKNIFAWTPPGFDPPYVSLNQQTDGTITLDVRGARKSDGSYGDCVRVILPGDVVTALAGAVP